MGFASLYPSYEVVSESYAVASNSALVPRTQRVHEVVRCRAGAHVSALCHAAFWVPALRSNACALQRVRDTRAVVVLYASANHRPAGADIAPFA